MYHRLPPVLWLAAAAAFAPGCADQQDPTGTPDVVRPVKTFLVESPEAGGIRKFPARIDAHRKAELAFRIPGTVAEILVKEGDRVSEGQEVARLDPRDYEITVSDRQANFDNASKNYERAKELVETGAISKTDFDRLEANFKQARAALDAAEQDLEYTRLEAPFGGFIARRYIQRFEEVQAKQTILALQDVSKLEVEFDIPESLIRGLRASGDQDSKTRDRVKVYASFDDLPGQQFPLTFKEIATKADPKTQTFEATFTMDQLERSTVLPGMTATVTADLSYYARETAVFLVPVDAVAGDHKLDPRVWIVEKPELTVKSRAVQLGRMLGDRIEITEGVGPGTRIVAAGAAFLAEGMKVTLMPDLEQAEPRPDDR